MAQIAEELLLLLLDNASAQPAIEHRQLDRVLAAAVLLDLAHGCRIRPAVPADAVEAGRLVVLQVPDPVDLTLAPALRLLALRPITAATAIARLRRSTTPMLLDHLQRTGQIGRITLHTRGPGGPVAWPLIDRTRAARARSALLSALFDYHRPDPSTAAIIALLHAVDGLGALLSLNDRGWYWVNARANEIAGGSWIAAGRHAPAAEVNLAVTTAAVLADLARR